MSVPFAVSEKSSELELLKLTQGGPGIPPETEPGSLLIIAPMQPAVMFVMGLMQLSPWQAHIWLPALAARTSLSPRCGRKTHPSAPPSKLGNQPGGTGSGKDPGVPPDSPAALGGLPHVDPPAPRSIETVDSYSADRSSQAEISSGCDFELTVGRIDVHCISTGNSIGWQHNTAVPHELAKDVLIVDGEKVAHKAGGGA
eukprot:SAG31_NODE_702_length_12723_cov_4.100206_6_plen_199_part_00